MINKKCDISMIKLAKVVLRPGKTARAVLGAAAEEISERRSSYKKEGA